MHQQPLTKLLKKDGFAWNEEAELAFEALKLAMTRAPVLAILDFNKTFVIEVDASGKGLGAVLMQEGRSISFYSKALSGRSLGLSTYKKEIMAIIKAVGR